MVINFAHLKKEMLVDGKGRVADGRVRSVAESKTQTERGHSQHQHYPALETDPQEQRPKQNPHTASRSFERSSTILAHPELGDYATPQDVFCYGCVNASVDAPGTTEEQWYCLQRKKKGEDGNGDRGGDLGDGQEFVFKPVRTAYLVGDCPLVKKGDAHREVNDG